MPFMRFAIFVSVCTVAASASAAISLPFRDPFNSAATATNYTVVGQDLSTATNDFGSNFGFSFASYVPDVTTTVPSPLPESPGFQAGDTATTALQLLVNQADSGGTDLAAISVYPLITMPAGFNYTVTVDVFQMWNGPPDVTGSGTTTFLALGSNATGASAEWPYGTTSGSGYFISLDGEGGFGNASTTIRDICLWDEARATAAPFPFTAIGTDGDQATAPLSTVFDFGSPVTPSYLAAGSPGRQWVTYELRYLNDTIRLTATPTVAGPGGVLYEGPNPAATNSGEIMIGHFDMTNSPAAAAVDNFLLIDNLRIDEYVILGTDDFSMYR